ncbi:MAG: shikimate kinase [Candidatus Caldarchaeum sp.]
MRGVGKAYGAVSIVNAISTGYGAALGINLQTEAFLELTSSNSFVLEINGMRSDPQLAEEVVRVFAQRLGLSVNGCRVSTKSEIPMAVGLKSSSSAAVAIAKAFLNAVDGKLPAEEFLKLVAEASTRSGTSITGALDDAAACMLGGVVVTNNHERKILKRDYVDSGLMTVIYIPPGKTYTRDFRRELLEPVRELALVAFNLAYEGHYWKAMTLNGLIHSAALGLPTQPALQALRAGALAAGLSGTGPAVAAVCKEGDVERVFEAFHPFEGRVIKCRINPSPVDDEP